MLQLVNLTVEFGGRPLFENLTWQINSRDRVALIGANGAGKSTMLKIMAGLTQASSGSVARSKVLRVGYLPQDGLHAHGKTLLHEVMTAFEEAITVHDRMRAIEHTLHTLDHEAPEYMKILEEYGDLQHRFEALDGFAIESKAAKILIGLGFKEAEFEKMCELFSGGWQMRIALAKLLLQNPDLLLLDEPTNHLDIESIEWLENYLRMYEGAVLMVSHDRYFINNVCDRITELERQKLTDYVGDYEAYEEQKALAEELLLNAFERQQDEMKRVQLFIDRFRYKATKARQAQSRIKMLDRMEKIALPEEERRAINFRFPQPVKSGRVVLEATGIHKAYGARTILESLDLTIERGEKIALVGANGAGKSTFLKIISGSEAADRGEIKLGHNVTLEYFAQQQSDKLDMSHTVYEEIHSAAVNQTPLMLRTILGAFLFSGDDINKKVRVLSGGERSRLAFAKMLLNPANFIILDEPTNHIDAQSKEILQGALSDYEGTLLIVSHDRHFLDTLVNKIIEVKDGSIKTYIGNFNDYHEQKAKEIARVMTETAKPVVAAEPKKTNPEREGQKKAQSEQRKLDKQRASIEEKIQQSESKKSQLEARLSDPHLYKSPERQREIQTEYRNVTMTISQLYAEWEKLSS